MNKIEKLTTNQRLARYYKVGEDINTQITKFNSNMYLMFDELSNFTANLPTHLNMMSGLADMITDALVITGRSSLSSYISEMNLISNSNIDLNRDTGVVKLEHSSVYEVPYKNNNSYINTENSYNIFNSSGNSLSSFNELLNGNSISIVSQNNYYKYTFCIEFASYLEINSLNLKLNLKTKSYPYISEIFYIDDENKRRYVTLLNNYKTSINLDEYRVPNNDYLLLFDNINVKRLYFTLEDRLNTELSIDKVSIRKVNYKDSGEIILGPVVSKYHILKASLEAEGDLEGVEFYLSNNTNDWTRIILPTEVNKSESATKIISFNTVSIDTLKINGQVKELYMKMVLRHQKLNGTNTSLLYKSSKYYDRVMLLDVNETFVQNTTYSNVSSTFFGERTYNTQLESNEILIDINNYIYTNGVYKVKGFISTDYSYNNTEYFNNVEVYSNYQKVNGDLIKADVFNPLTSNTYGYVINKVKKTYNTITDDNIVLQVNSNYSNDTYTIRQNNKELKIDLSLGFITNTLAVTIGVETEGSVFLYDSTGRLVKKLTKHIFDDFHYISLIKEGIIETPVVSVKEKLIFNDLYPLKLNEDNEYGILDKMLVSVKTLIDFDEYSLLTLDKLETSLKLSKENKNTLTINDKYTKDKYTIKTKETIKAYPESRALKLQNKFIKKGSLRIIQK